MEFGEKIEGYEVNVLNEREIRGGTAILFLFAIIGFFFSVFKGDYTITKLFVGLFLIDFVIRLHFSPKYSPVLISSSTFWYLSKILIPHTSILPFAFFLYNVLSIGIFFRISKINFNNCYISSM